jgi:hypothetical protein
VQKEPQLEEARTPVPWRLLPLAKPSSYSDVEAGAFDSLLDSLDLESEELELESEFFDSPDPSPEEPAPLPPFFFLP